MPADVAELSLNTKFSNFKLTSVVVVSKIAVFVGVDLIITPPLLSPIKFKDLVEVSILESTIYSPFLIKIVSPPVAAPTAAEIVV